MHCSSQRSWRLRSRPSSRTRRPPIYRVIRSIFRGKLPVSHCPNCKSKDLRLSHTRSRWERWRRDITGKRPYRCRACQWRGWKNAGLGEDAPTSTLRTNVPDPPNLRGTAFARPDSDTRKINLKDLDRFHTTHENKDQG